MTIIEIEETLHTLEKRHSNLTEETLLTLLQSSGWEDKIIREAVVIWRASRALPDGHPSQESNQAHILEDPSPAAVREDVAPVHREFGQEGMSVPTTDTDVVYYDGSGVEEKKITTFVDIGKDIPQVESKNIPPYTQQKVVIQEKQEQVSLEPQSLVAESPVPVTSTRKVELPDNLPLKPFESSEHVWPLSRYKDVFHGTTPPILSRVEVKLVDEHKDEHKDRVPVKAIKLKRTGFDGEDEGLIIMTGVSLFVVLLLLAYMYSNGRL